MNAVFNYARLEAAHALLRTDTCDIARHVETKRPNGTTAHTVELIAAGVPCRWSQPSKPDKSQDLPDPSVTVSAKLFCLPDVDIRAGDVITMYRDGMSRVFDAGDPFRYTAHQEVPLHRRERV